MLSPFLLFILDSIKKKELGEITDWAVLRFYTDAACCSAILAITFEIKVEYLCIPLLACTPRIVSLPGT